MASISRWEQSQREQTIIDGDIGEKGKSQIKRLKKMIAEEHPKSARIDWPSSTRYSKESLHSLKRKAFKLGLIPSMITDSYYI